MSTAPPEESALSNVVVMGRLLGCCGPLEKAVAARKISKTLRSFIVLLLCRNYGFTGKTRRPPHRHSNRYDGLRDTVSVNARYFRPCWKGIDVPSFKVILKRSSVFAFDSVGFFFPLL